MVALDINIKFPEEAIKALETHLDPAVQLKQFDKWARKVLQAIYVSNIRRIHNEGKAVDMASIGKYGTKPMYISPKKSPVNFSPIGKTKKSTFLSGKSHKTRFFPGGYKDFRQSIGRETSGVNLQLSGKLKEDWTLLANGNEWALGFRSRYGTELRKAMEEKYKKIIWGVTIDDEHIIEKITDAHIADILKDLN